MYAFEMNMENFKHMDFSTPLFISDIVLLQRWPNEQSRLGVIAKPFDLMV